MTAFANVTPTNMELTPMRVTFKGVDLGGTLKNVKVSIKTTKAQLHADQFGKSPIDARVSGHTLMVETELVEVKNKDIWKTVFPNSKKVGTGPHGIYFQSMVGDSDLANAGELVLHPLSLPDADKSGDYKFYVACADANSDLTYGPDGQVVMKVSWHVYLDTSVQPARLMYFGDSAIGLVAASIAAAVAGGGNTGNGTVSGLVAFSGLTKTETITLACLVGGPTGKFTVTGSVSGALGIATVGTPFVSPVAALTINDGAADFVAGDTFTIATTAANYA